MATYTNRIGLLKQADGENPNSWGTKLNENVIDLVDEAVAGYEAISLDGVSTSVVLTDTDGVTNQARNAGLRFTGELAGDVSVTLPAQEKIYYIANDTTGSYNILVGPVGGQYVTAVSQGFSMILATDGTSTSRLEQPTSVLYASSASYAASAGGLTNGANITVGAVTASSLTVITTLSARDIYASVATLYQIKTSTVSATQISVTDLYAGNIIADTIGVSAVSATIISATDIYSTDQIFGVSVYTRFISPTSGSPRPSLKFDSTAFTFNDGSGQIVKFANTYNEFNQRNIHPDNSIYVAPEVALNTFSSAGAPLLNTGTWAAYFGTFTSANGRCVVFGRGLTPTCQVSVNGSGGSFENTSDYRLKENINSLENYIDRIKKLKAVSFNYKTERKEDITEGFIAHEVQEAGFGFLVSGEKDGEEIQTLNYIGFIPGIITALQEAINKIEVLESKVSALENS